MTIDCSTVLGALVCSMDYASYDFLGYEERLNLLKTRRNNIHTTFKTGIPHNTSNWYARHNMPGTMPGTFQSTCRIVPIQADHSTVLGVRQYLGSLY